MNCLKKPWTFSAVALSLSLLNACGVKGDPLPPEKPPEIGRGRPTYKRASEGIKVEKHRRDLSPDRKHDGKTEDGDDD